MSCPDCQADTKVVDTHVRGKGVERMRQCTSCQRRFVTNEQFVEWSHLKNVRYRGVKSQSRVPNDRELIAHQLRELEGPLTRPLNAWAEEFLECAKEHFHRRGGLSEKQRAVLGRLYAEHTA